MRENIKVAIRIRPSLSDENQGATRRISIMNKKELKYQKLTRIVASDTSKQMKYDLIADPYCSQDQLFHSVGMPGYLRRLFEGYSSTVFCYGSTGSGKTYTMQGETGGSGVCCYNVRKLKTAWKGQIGV